MKLRTFTRAAAVCAGAAALVLSAAGPAAADPPAGEFRALAGVGSDTTQDVVNGLAQVVRDGANNRVIASYDARGSARIKTKATACEFNRPNGSTAGRTALRTSEGELNGGVLPPGDNILGCVDFARSSSYPNPGAPATTGLYTYIPIGADAVSLAINTNGDLPRNISFARVQRVYKCLDRNIGGVTITPLLIQAGSGTRQFWLQQMEITETEISLGDYRCLTDANGVPLITPAQEHDGTAVNGHNDYVVPISASQYVAQGNSAAILAATGVTVADRRGEAILTGLSTVANPTPVQPIVGGLMNPNYPINRDVYNVVPTADLGNATIADTFVGANSKACTASTGGNNVVQLFGFGLRAATTDLLHQTCGTTTLKANT